MHSLRKSAKHARAVAVFVSLLATRDLSAQGLRVTVELSKAEFFEGEPIYVLAKVTNVGPDTAWIAPFHFASEALRMNLTRKDAVPVPYHGIVADLRVGRAWRGIPLPPDADAYESAVLQSWWGIAEARGLFLDRLLAGEYELSVAFDAYELVAGSAPIVIEAQSVRF